MGTIIITSCTLIYDIIIKITHYCSNNNMSNNNNTFNRTYIKYLFAN